MEREGIPSCDSKTEADRRRTRPVEGEYTYRCILTNDYESSEKEIVEFYNLRGGKERIFDDMNNDSAGTGFQNPSWEKTRCSSAYGTHTQLL